MPFFGLPCVVPLAPLGAVVICGLEVDEQAARNASAAATVIALMDVFMPPHRCPPREEFPEHGIRSGPSLLPMRCIFHEK
jgi:hypothetical protein